MGYLGNGLTITGTQNSKRIVVDATPNQTISTVTGGYLVGQLDVYRNGVKLVDTQDYTASDGASVTFLSAASEGDELEFVVFENFDVASALSKSGGSLNGDLVVTGIATFNSDVSIGGTLTYEDVTNIDSVGLITARDGIHVVGNGVSVASGIITAGSGVHIGPITGVAATLTAAGGAVFTGVVTATTFSGGTFTGDGTGLTGVASTDNINTSTLAQFTGGVGIADSIFHIGDDNTAIRFPAADTFTVETGGSERLRIDSSGHLGLGISPSDIDSIGRALNIASSTGGAVYLQDTDSPTTKFGVVSYNGETAALQIHAHHSSSYIDFGTNGTERLRILSDGKVGVGTTVPASIMHIHDNSASTNVLFQASAGTNNAFFGMRGSSAYKAISANDAYIYQNGQNIAFQADHAASVIKFAAGGNQEQVRITSAGDVGIGTNSPDGRLHVFEGSSGTVTANGNANDLVVENSGTGGISILTPDANHGYIIFGSPTSNEGAILRYRDSDNLFTIGTEDADGQVVFRSGAGTERLRIGSSGQIGLSGANYGDSGQVLTSNGSGSAPTWQDASGGITTHVGTASGIVTSVFLNDATDHKVTVTGIVTFTATQAGTEGQSHTIRIVNSGIATVGFSTYFLFPSGAAPVLPTADGAVSLISFTVHDSVGAGCTQLLAGASVNFS